MRLQDIIGMARNYLELGIVLFVALVVVFVVGYWVIYRKLCKGKKQINFKRVFWWMILIFYLFVVLSVTLFRRSGFWNGEVVSFFYSYKEAWVSASASAWSNIVLNILMLVPLGFWLPIGMRWFRAFWKTYLFGFVLTIGIEFLQLTFSLGIFEIADVFNNTLGTMIGYGCYKIVEYFVLLFKKEKPNLYHMLLNQVPLVLAVVMFSTIYVAYQTKELGNLSIECITPYADGTFHIISNEEYSEKQENALVYQVNVLSVEETEAFAREFFENLGEELDESRNDIYDDTAVYWARDNYSIWIDYKGGSFRMTDFNTSFPDENEEEPCEVTNASKETILQALSEYGIEIPEEASFSYNPAGYTFEVNRTEIDGIMYDGILTCQYYDNGKFSDIRNNIIQLEGYKEFEICSEQTAFEQILDGIFVSGINAGSKIEMRQVSLEYMLDTKGFYQPI